MPFIHQEHPLQAVQNANLVRCLVRWEPVQLLQGADLVLEGVEEGATEGEVDVDGLLGMGGGPLHLGSGGDGDDEDDEGEPGSEEEEEEEEEEDPDGFGVEVILLALMSPCKLALCRMVWLRNISYRLHLWGFMQGKLEEGEYGGPHVQDVPWYQDGRLPFIPMQCDRGEHMIEKGRTLLEENIQLKPRMSIHDQTQLGAAHAWLAQVEDSPAAGRGGGRRRW